MRQRLIFVHERGSAPIPCMCGEASRSADLLGELPVGKPPYAPRFGWYRRKRCTAALSTSAWRALVFAPAAVAAM